MSFQQATFDFMCAAQHSLLYYIEMSSFYPVCSSSLIWPKSENEVLMTKLVDW